MAKPINLPPKPKISPFHAIIDVPQMNKAAALIAELDNITPDMADDIVDYFAILIAQCMIAEKLDTGIDRIDANAQKTNLINQLQSAGMIQELRQIRVDVEDYVSGKYSLECLQRMARKAKNELFQWLKDKAYG